MSDPVRTFSELRVAVANQHRGTPILFMLKTTQLEEKNYGPKPPKSSSTIINVGYSKFFSKEHYMITYINISCIFDATTRFRTQELGIGAISPKYGESTALRRQVSGSKLHNLVGNTGCLISTLRSTSSPFIIYWFSCFLI